MTELATTLATLLETPVTAENQVERNTEVTKLREQMAQVQADITTKNTRMAELQSQFQSNVERLKTKAWRMGLRQNASEAVHQRRHMSRLPPNYEPMHLFNTPQDAPVQGARTGIPEAPFVPPEQRQAAIAGSTP